MEKDWLPRNFGVVSDRIIENLVVVDPQKDQERLAVLSELGFPLYLVEIVEEHLIEISQRDFMTVKEHQDFLDCLEKIHRDIYYISPEECHYVIWEKLGVLCRNYLGFFEHTEWARRISRIVRGLE